MRKPTDQQQVILDCESPVRLVSAAPGSGKTWLIGERIKITLSRWRLAQRGIAALTFTNAAREEIIDAVGFQLGHPHFIGTLDSFVFRYIVRPFGHLYQPGLKNVRIVPAHFAADMAEQQNWFQATYTDKNGKIRNSGLLITLNKEPRKVAHVFASNFLDLQNGEPIFTIKEAFKSEPAQLSLSESRLILKRKLEVWEKSGRVSHSDCAFIAYQLLLGPHGASIKGLLARRFPAIIIDELQDTGYFLGHVMLSLFQHGEFKGMMVGDPDQAIYEFSGAHPSLFSRFSTLGGAKLHEMSRSERCPDAICQVANHLASSRRTISGNGRVGFAGIGWYDGLGHGEVENFANAVASRNGQLRIVARKNSELLKIRGIDNDEGRTVIGGSKTLEKLRRAVHFLRVGNATKALDLAGSVLSRVLLESDHITETELSQTVAKSATEWRDLKLSLLMEAFSQSNSSISEWCPRMVEVLRNLISNRGWSRTDFPKWRMPIVPKDLSSKPLFPTSLPSPNSSLRYLTVHGAKGQTHDTTLYFVGSPTKDSPCPSITWFEPNSEERRVAFVAATRARNNFVLCVPKASLDRLVSTRPNFVRSFTQVGALMDLIPNLCLDGAMPTPLLE